MSKKKKSSKKGNSSFFKNAGKAICNFFKKVYQLIDRFIITPVTKFLLMIMSIFKRNSKPLDRLFNNKAFLITFSLILSLGVFYIFDHMTDSIVNQSAEILTNIPVRVINGSEDYVVEGLPETVDVTLIGKTSYLYLAKQYASDEVIVDLKGKTPRDEPYTVELKYMGSVPSVEYKLDHATAEIHIYEKMSEARTISQEVVNLDKIDSRYIISDIEFDREEVYIQGPAYRIEQVATVKALVDVTKINNLTSGTVKKDDIPLIAYDANGERVDIDIVPSTISADITIKSPSKEVPFRVEPVGDVVFGKAIDSIELDKSTVTIYGDEATLAEIDYLPVKIDVSNMDSNRNLNINVTKPSGVRSMSVNTLAVKVTLDDIQEKVITDVNITTRNLANGYIAKATSREDSMITVIVKGTERNLEAITKDNIQAYVDLQGLQAGTHNVQVNVTGDDLKLSYVAQKETVTIKISSQ